MAKNNEYGILNGYVWGRKNGGRYSDELLGRTVPESICNNHCSKDYDCSRCFYLVDSDSWGSPRCMNTDVLKNFKDGIRFTYVNRVKVREGI